MKTVTMSSMNNMPTLFSKDYRYTYEAQCLNEEVNNALRPIFAKYYKLGYSPREIEYVIHHTTTEISLDAVLWPDTFDEPAKLNT